MAASRQHVYLVFNDAISSLNLQSPASAVSKCHHWVDSKHGSQLTLCTCDWVAMCKLARWAAGSKKALAELTRRPRLDVAWTCISPAHSISTALYITVTTTDNYDERQHCPCTCHPCGGWVYSEAVFSLWHAVTADKSAALCCCGVCCLHSLMHFNAGTTAKIDPSPGGIQAHI